MVSDDTRSEIDETIGLVPEWMESIAAPAADQSWEIFRDLVLGETDLSAREKALVGVGVASAIQCPYCSHFHTEEAKLAGVSGDEIEEAATLAGSTRYFSTVLHGNQVDHDEFVDETAEIVDYLGEETAAADD